MISHALEYYRIRNEMQLDRCPQCPKGYCVACANAYVYMLTMDVKRKEHTNA